MRIQNFAKANYVNFKPIQFKENEQMQTNYVEKNICTQICTPRYISFKGSEKRSLPSSFTRFLNGYDEKKPIDKYTKEELVKFANQKKPDGTYRFNDEDLDTLAEFSEVPLSILSYANLKDAEGNFRFNGNDIIELLFATEGKYDPKMAEPIFQKLINHDEFSGEDIRYLLDTYFLFIDNNDPVRAELAKYETNPGSYSLDTSTLLDFYEKYIFSSDSLAGDIREAKETLLSLQNISTLPNFKISAEDMKKILAVFSSSESRIYEDRVADATIQCEKFIESLLEIKNENGKPRFNGLSINFLAKQYFDIIGNSTEETMGHFIQLLNESMKTIDGDVVSPVFEMWRYIDEKWNLPIGN